MAEDFGKNKGHVVIELPPGKHFFMTATFKSPWEHSFRVYKPDGTAARDFNSGRADLQVPYESPKNVSKGNEKWEVGGGHKYCPPDSFQPWHESHHKILKQTSDLIEIGFEDCVEKDGYDQMRTSRQIGPDGQPYDVHFSLHHPAEHVESNNYDRSVLKIEVKQ